MITDPNDFALISGLYRTSIDGRHWMSEAILSGEDYEIPDNFTSRTAQIVQVYLKSLGVRMETIIDEDEYIGEPEHLSDSIGFQVGDKTIFCSTEEMYYLKKMQRIYKKYIAKYPGNIDDVDEVWDYIVENLPFSKKHLTEHIIDMFRSNLDAFAV